jgi:superoxide dismutase, Fe-Mn family
MAFTLQPLPYSNDALAPAISERTLQFHHGKHHAAYVKNLNDLITGKKFEQMTLEDVIMESWSAKDTGVFNNAAQIWNHTFYWSSMKPDGGGKPKGDIASMIDKDFGSYDGFVDEFKKAGATQFGSGWTWLILDGGELKVMKTPNAELPMTASKAALITMDVWEHAYYLDYQNRRPDYIVTFLEKLVNWEFANRNLK